jgi:hypothetical protein
MREAGAQVLQRVVLPVALAVRGHELVVQARGHGLGAQLAPQALPGALLTLMGCPRRPRQRFLHLRGPSSITAIA